MTAETTDSSFVLADPRRMDGTPYQVAERAIRQVAAAAIRLSEALDAADVMARNAELERTTALDPEADLKPVAMNGRRAGRTGTLEDVSDVPHPASRRAGTPRRGRRAAL